MSNLSDTKKNPGSIAPSPVVPASIDQANSGVFTAPAKISRWSFIHSDLTKAMDTWQELDSKESGISPEEEQLAKIKTIIAQLKAKLEQF